MMLSSSFSTPSSFSSFSSAPATEFGDLIESIRTLNTDDTFRTRLDSQQWRALAGYMTRHEIKRGDLLIRQGDTDRVMYLIGSGSFQAYLTRESDHQMTPIALLRAGSICGEPSLFCPSERFANVEAMTNAKVWALRFTRFEEMMQRMPAVALEVLRAAGCVMAQRMRANVLSQMPFA